MAGLCYTGRNGDVAHLVERGIRIAEVVGSSPIVSTSFTLKLRTCCFRSLARLEDVLRRLKLRILSILPKKLIPGRDALRFLEVQAGIVSRFCAAIAQW